MPYKFQPGKIYRMPTHFGPSQGPRQAEEGTVLFSADRPKRTTVRVSFETNPAQLEELMPQGYTLIEPIVTVSATYMTEIVWLAGRGYNILGVSFPAIFQGKQDRVEGNFLTVLWESLADPIITGREDLGVPKIYCEIPPLASYLDHVHVTAGWLGFKFMDMRVRKLHPPTQAEIERLVGNEREGLLTYKYFPRTGDWGEADAEYTTFNPAHDPYRKVLDVQAGEGTVEFHHATWEDLPTQHHIVNTFHNLEFRSFQGAYVIKTEGGKDLSDQRILY